MSRRKCKRCGAVHLFPCGEVKTSFGAIKLIACEGMEPGEWSLEPDEDDSPRDSKAGEREP